MGSNQAFGVTSKASWVCPKVALKSGSLICTKVSGKLKWEVVKKPQVIKYSAPLQAAITDKQIDFRFSSSSILAVVATPLTPDVCVLGESMILILGIPGLCRFSLNQSGNAYYSAAKSLIVEIKISGTNVIDFSLPGALLLSQGTYPIAATSSSNLTVSLTSTTTSVCTVANSTLTLLTAGTCTLVATQSGANFIPKATAVTQSVEISTVRVIGDLPDTISGFQIKPVYVVPSDAPDNSYDTNGVIAGLLKEGSDYLHQGLGLTFPIDSTASSYDITYLKSSRPTSYFLTSKDADFELLQEVKFLDNPGSNRKNYVFFVDVPNFENGVACGYARNFSIIAVIAVGQDHCGKPGATFSSYASMTWVHEVLHDLGVRHVPESCDLMFSDEDFPSIPRCAFDVTPTIDKSNNQYVKSSNYGQNILQLRVWNGHTSDGGLLADCWLGTPITRVDGVPYAYCPTGSQSIGALTYCWDSISSDSLQENVNGAWIDLGHGEAWVQPWGSRIAWKCDNPNSVAPWKQVTVDTPGLRHYRWVVNGQVAEDLNIIWVR